MASLGHPEFGIVTTSIFGMRVHVMKHPFIMPDIALLPSLRHSCHQVTNEHAIDSPISVGLISLGCAKNLVDSEIMIGNLIKDGISITNTPEKADVVIVNTCSFIDSAQEESVDTILESAEMRKVRNLGQGLIVAGCLTQRYRKELPKLMPEVDVFMGIDQVEEVSQLVQVARKRRLQRPSETEPTSEEASPSEESSDSASEAPVMEVTARPVYIPDVNTPRFRLTPAHFAYLKIAEGCNHPCSFCIIPRMRGSHRSRQAEDILAEAKALIAEGVKEINLISQDSTYYGLDLRENPHRGIASPEKFQEASASLPENASTLSSLLRDLNQLEGDFWIRVLYTHPAHWTDELIATIASCDKVAKYVDIPLQHIHPTMLERMRRETSRDYIEKLLERIRKGIPGIAIRTTFIVGFPGETEGCFQSLLDFIQATRFERMGVFTYSHEEGTRAGGMANAIDDSEKAHRRDRAMAIQRDISRTWGSEQVGKTFKVLIEAQADEKTLEDAMVRSWEHGHLRSDQEPQAPVLSSDEPWMVARGQADAPDIDGRIYVRGSLPAHTFQQVRITGHTDYDLLAEPA